MTEEALDRLASLAGDACRRTGSLRLADDDEERDALAVEYEALRADGFAAEWVDEPMSGRFPRRSSTPATPRCSRRAGCAGSRCSPPRPAPRSASTSASSRSTTLDAGAVLVATDGYPSGLLGRARGADRPDARPDDRDRAARASASSTARTTAATASTTGSRPRTAASWPAASATRRCRTSSRREETLTPQIQGELEAFVAQLVGRPDRGRVPLGRDLRPGARLPAGRRPRAGRRARLGRRRLLGPRQRARADVRRARRAGDARTRGARARLVRPGAAA